MKGSKRSRIATLKGTAPRISDDTNQRRSLGNRSVRSPEHRAAPTDPALKCQKLKATKTRSTGHQQCQKASENLAVFKISNGRCLIHSLTTITSVDMVKLAPKPKTHWSTSRGQGSCWGNFLLELSEAPGLWGRGRRTVPSRGVWKVGSIKRNSGPSTKLSICFLSSLQAAPSRSHQNSIAQLVMVNVHTVKMHLTFYVLMTQLQAHSRTWPWPPPLFYRESIACPIFLQTTLDTGINRIQNRNHSITPRITPLHLIILHHVSLSYLYFTPHNPVHPVRKRSPQKKSPQTGSIC